MITIRNTILLALLALALFRGIDLWDFRSADAREFERLWEGRQRLEAIEFLDGALERHPHDRSLHRARVMTCLSRELDSAPAQAALAVRAMQERVGRDPVLRRALADRSPVVRRNAALAAGQLRMQEVRRGLEDLVQDPERAVRLAALRALGDLRARASTFHMLLALKDPDWEVRAEAARSLGRVGADGEARRLFRCLEDEDAFVRLQARVALLALASPRMRSEAVRRLGAHPAQVRAVAAACLARLGELRGAETLASMIVERGGAQRVLAVELFAEVDPERARRLFTDLVEEEADEEVQSAMAKALLERSPVPVVESACLGAGSGYDRLEKTGRDAARTGARGAAAREA